MLHGRFALVIRIAPLALSWDSTGASSLLLRAVRHCGPKAGGGRDPPSPLQYRTTTGYPDVGRGDLLIARGCLCVVLGLLTDEDVSDLFPGLLDLLPHFADRPLFALL